MGDIFLHGFIIGGFVLFLSWWLGRLFEQYQDNYRPLASLFKSDSNVGFNAVYRISIAPVGVVGLSIVFYYLNLDSWVKDIWVASVWYLVLQGFSITIRNTWQLINKAKFFLFHLISILLTLYIYNSLIVKGLPHLLPDEANLRTDLWLLIAGLLYGVFKSIPENQAKFEERKSQYIKSRASDFLHKYKNELDGYDSLFQDILLSIMIYENYNRPRVARVVEKIWRGKTQGIMQVNGAKSDVESIKKAAKSLKRTYEDMNNKTDKSTSDLYNLFQSYNPGDPTYSYEVWTIFNVLNPEFFKHSVSRARKITDYRTIKD